MRVQRRGPSTVRINPASAGPLAWNATRRQMEAPPTDLVYVGPAIIGPVNATPREVASVEDDVSVRTYDVQLDRDYHGVDAVAIGHVVTVTASPDPQMEGRVLNITSVDQGDPRRPRIVATLND